MIHIGEFLVFAAHCPDEGIVLCADAGVDGPGGRDNSLLVMHDDVSCLGGLTHHVEDSIVLTHIKVEVNLHTAIVGMGGHSVPVRATVKLGTEGAA